MKRVETDLGSSARLRTMLALLQIASPALPVGGFAYSQGLESAISDGRVNDAASAQRWIADMLSLVLARFEAPVWLRIYDAVLAQDEQALVHWNEELLATRETAELRAEALQMGTSMLRVYTPLNLTVPPLPDATYTAAFAIACAQLGIERLNGLAAYLWAWTENQVLVVVKTVPLGQQAGQAMLFALHSNVQQTVETAATLTADDLGTAAIGFALRSARHETQYSRLFRS
jgi:urease accessory protein